MTDDPLDDYLNDDELARRRARRAEVAQRETDRKHQALAHIAALRQQLRETQRR